MSGPSTGTTFVSPYQAAQYDGAGRHAYSADSDGETIFEYVGPNNEIDGCIAFSEEVTLDTGDTTNTLTTQIPSGTYRVTLKTYVTTTISTAVSFSVGVASSTDRFIASDTNVTAGDTNVAVNGTLYSTATAIVLTTNANPGAGAVRVSVLCWYARAPIS